MAAYSLFCSLVKPCARIWIFCRMLAQGFFYPKKNLGEMPSYSLRALGYVEVSVMFARIMEIPFSCKMLMPVLQPRKPMKEAIMDKEMMNAVATDAFAQAQEGFAVPLDPDLADALGAFPEDMSIVKVQARPYIAS
ncbi:hypothetical protein [uncultured Desulfovibrio sp.]|uniref:hypothetical protein n=1 Tax=uncultured Desulfovibrio sp. TaxID=167968 RepID=UPI002639A6AE|nr:hypothetical protein [uncultured Desulfovibrio sp.]